MPVPMPIPMPVPVPVGEVSAARSNAAALAKLWDDTRTKLKINVSAYQIVTAVSFNFSVTLPPSVSAFLGSFAFVSLDL